MKRKQKVTRYLVTSRKAVNKTAYSTKRRANSELKQIRKDKSLVRPSVSKVTGTRTKSGKINISKY